MSFSTRAASILLVLFPLVAAPWACASFPATGAEYAKAPPFSGTTLSSQEITHKTLFDGHPFVVLLFFGVNCKPCQKEIVQLNEVWRNDHFREKARIYAINADGFSPVKLSAEMAKRNITVDFPVVPDENQVITNLYVDGIVPLTVVIDRQNRIVLSMIGARIESVKKIEALILAGQERKP